MLRVVVKRGDLLPSARGTCLEPDGSAVDLTDASLVCFAMTPEHPGAGPDVQQAAVVVGDPADGVVEYAWQEGDTDVVGVYRAEFRVIFGAGGRRTYPQDGYLEVEVEASATA